MTLSTILLLTALWLHAIINHNCSDWDTDCYTIIRWVLSWHHNGEVQTWFSTDHIVWDSDIEAHSFSRLSERSKRHIDLVIVDHFHWRKADYIIRDRDITECILSDAAVLKCTRRVSMNKWPQHTGQPFPVSHPGGAPRAFTISATTPDGTAGKAWHISMNKQHLLTTPVLTSTWNIFPKCRMI